MIYLNMEPGTPPLVLHVSEGDIGREISLTLISGGTEYVIPSGAEITLEMVKADGHGTTINCTYNGAEVTFKTTEQSTLRAGKAIAELRITDGESDLGTANFFIAVEPRPINADTDQTDSSYSMTGNAGDVWALGPDGSPRWITLTGGIDTEIDETDGILNMYHNYAAAASGSQTDLTEMTSAETKAILEA